MNKFLQKFNEITKNKYSYIRTSNVKLDEKANQLSITFIIPYDIYNDEKIFNSDFKSEIQIATSQIISPKVSLKIKFDKILISNEVVIRYINAFIKQNYIKVFDGNYIQKDIKVDVLEDEVHIYIPVYETIYSYCVNYEVDRKLEEYLDEKYHLKNVVQFMEIELPLEEEKRVPKSNLFVDNGVVLCEKGLVICGAPFTQNPIYITRCRNPKPNVTVCGFVSKFEKKVAKSGKIFFKFKVQDPTDNVMNCIYFPRYKKSSNTIHKFSIEKIQEGMDIVVNGELMEDSFNNSVTLFAKNICRAKIDVEGTKEKIAFAKRQQKKAEVKDPVPYVYNTNTQITLFDEQPYVCPLLMENDIVVFDLETTGTIVNKDMIIEIGAVKISHGEIVSTFQTLVDPKIHVPIGASKINNIYDEMLVDAPFIDDVLYKFSDYITGCILVGQNSDKFDIPLLKREMENYGYILDNKTYDTMVLDAVLRPTAKGRSLANLCEYYKVENKQAHRGLSDALATAQIFMKMANELKLQ